MQWAREERTMMTTERWSRLSAILLSAVLLVLGFAAVGGIGIGRRAAQAADRDVGALRQHHQLGAALGRLEAAIRQEEDESGG